MLIGLTQSLSAATITVNGQTSDSTTGVCDLVEAIENANDNADTHTDCIGAGAYGADTIELTVDVTLDAISESDPVVGSTGLPRITSTIEIQGNYHTIGRAAGAPPFRIFLVWEFDGDLTLQNTVVSGGSALGGGAILNRGTTRLVNSTLRGNSASSNGGGIRSDGFLAVIGSGTLEVTGSTLSGNSAGLHGGAIFTSGPAATVVTNSTLSGNSASFVGGGIARADTGTLEVTGSTLSGNSANDDGGAIYIFPAATTVVTNSTLSGNRATNVGGAIANHGSLELFSSTLAGNSAGGGAIWNSSTGTTTLSGSIFANGPNNCAGFLIVDDGGNLADDPSCGFVTPPLSGLDPALADNGGSTKTHALLEGSTAIDRAGAAPGDCPGTDQRSANRENLCDSGAFEFLTCDDLSFSGDMIGGTETRWNCKKIVADFTVLGTGDLTLRAGTGIELRNETSVETGGALSLVNDPGLQVGRAVFVTSSTANSVFGGLSAANTQCNLLASLAGLSGAYKAWLSDSMSSPADNFFQSPAPYYRVDGVRVADNWWDLTDGQLQNSINLDESGQPAFAFTWTATRVNGDADPPEFCGDWQQLTGNGKLGCPAAPNSLWTECFVNPCNLVIAALYCFEQ